MVDERQSCVRCELVVNCEGSIDVALGTRKSGAPRHLRMNYKGILYAGISGAATSIPSEIILGFH